MSALDFVHQAMEHKVASQLLDVEVNSPFGIWYGDDMEPVLRFISFAGLVELGLRAGYLHLMEWEGARLLEQSLREFRTENPAAERVDLHLLDALIVHFDAPPSGSWSFGEVAFASFESYLALSGRLRGDGAVRSFLEQTSGHRVPAGDWAALLSPRHFADAFADGTIEGVPVTDVSAGYRLLGYLERLADILESLREHTELRSGIVRHARWVSRAERIRDRFGFWVQRMREWDRVSNEAWSDELWSAYAQRIFGTLVAEQERLNAPRPWVQPEHQQEPVVEEFNLSEDKQLEQLLAEGRVGAARELLLKKAMQMHAEMGERMLGSADFFPWAEDLVALGRVLAQMGSEDAAAALVAPIVPRLVTEYGESDCAGHASALVSSAREGRLRHRQESQEAPASGERVLRALDQREEKPHQRSWRSDLEP